MAIALLMVDVYQKETRMDHIFVTYADTSQIYSTGLHKYQTRVCVIPLSSLH